MIFWKNCIRTLGFIPHINLVLSNTGQGSAHYLVSRDGGPEHPTVRGWTVPGLLYREATAVNSNSGPLESPLKDG